MGAPAKLKIPVKSRYILLALVFVAAIFAAAGWTINTQQSQMEVELHEKGKVLSQQMAAVWEFMTSNQERFEEADYSPTGSYQGLHCAVAGRTISKLFTLQSDYVTRYVNFDPRNVEDSPDNFETAGLNEFYGNPDVKEFYGIVEYAGKDAYRYMAPMEVKEACLKCHGTPVGELDLTGNPKEGWKIGQVGGAISIVIPMDLYESSMRQNITQSVLFSGLLLVVLAIIAVAATKVLGNYNQHLEAQTVQLENANRRLEEESQYKTDFLNTVSHELRTPLTSIVAFSEMLSDENLPEEKEKTVREGIDASSRTLLLKVNNLLEASRFNAGRMKLEKGVVDMCELASFVELVITPLAQRSNLSFEVQVQKDTPLVYGDFDRLLQILENLCANSVKFTPEGGSISMLIDYHADLDEVWMRVTDTGIGIPEEDLERVFQPFESSSSTVHGTYYGTGLGLPFSRTCAEMHGGTIEVESVVGEGSIFTVKIPVGDEQGAANHDI